MAVQLDHLLVPSRDRATAAEFLAGLLGVPWAVSGVGPFSPVYVNDGLTLDFDQAEGEFPTLHFCFRVSDTEFDAILARIVAAGVAYRSSPHGPVDSRINAAHAGASSTGASPTGTSGKC